MVLDVSAALKIRKQIWHPYEIKGKCIGLDRNYMYSVFVWILGPWMWMWLHPVANF